MPAGPIGRVDQNQLMSVLGIRRETKSRLTAATLMRQEHPEVLRGGRLIHVAHLDSMVDLDAMRCVVNKPQLFRSVFGPSLVDRPHGGNG